MERNILTRERLVSLRLLMRKKHIDTYLIFLSDDHGSETVGDHYKEIEYLTGFTGTNAAALVTQERALLWTDGRYFIQAEKELSGSGVKLMRMGEKDVPAMEEYINKHVKKNQTVAFDGRRVSVSRFRRITDAVKKGRGRVSEKDNLFDTLWTDRPARSEEPVWILEDRYAGSSAEKKLSRIRKAMKKAGADAFVLSDLTDIAWLLNLRGGDIANVPVFYSYFFMTKKKAVLYVQSAAVNSEVRAHLEHAGVDVKPYEKFTDAVKKLGGAAVLFDPDALNAAVFKAFPKKVKLIEAANPTRTKKAKKNAKEIAHLKKLHAADGAAVTRFIYYLKTHVGKERITESDAAKMLDAMRAEIDGFIELSFPTISACGKNAALPHYEPRENHDAVLRPHGLYLVDSGGHYKTGTTDVTRTIALGGLSREEIDAYTNVLRAHLRLMGAVFLAGTSFQNLDILARGPLWDARTDYRHGTGHGVGFALNVHEGPNAFRMKGEQVRIRRGMVTTDEPGLYIEGSFGVRTENELLCVADEKNEYGRFLRFESLTLVPIDLEATDVSMLTQYEKQTLNAYHRRVYEEIAPLLNDEEREWLAYATREV